MSKAKIGVFVGEKCGNAKFTNKEADKIRELYDKTPNKYGFKTRMAKKYGVVVTTITNILNSKTYYY